MGLIIFQGMFDTIINFTPSKFHTKLIIYFITFYTGNQITSIKYKTNP